MPNIGPMEIVLLVIVLLLVFGPKRLPEMGRSVGKGIREFKESVSGNDDVPDEPEKTTLTPPPPGPAQETARQPEAERIPN